MDYTPKFYQGADLAILKIDLCCRNLSTAFVLFGNLSMDLKVFFTPYTESIITLLVAC